VNPTTIQPRPLPETISEWHANDLLCTVTTVEMLRIKTNDNNFNCIK